LSPLGEVERVMVVVCIGGGGVIVGSAVWLLSMALVMVVQLWWLVL